MSRLLIAALAGALLLPAAADAKVFKDKARGYTLKVNTKDPGGQGVSLRIPRRQEGAQVAYVVTCKGDILLGVQPITPSRKLTAPLPDSWSKRKRQCRLEVNEDPTASFKLKRA